MTITDFEIGGIFRFAAGNTVWKCYDVGSRVVVANPSTELDGSEDDDMLPDGDDYIVFVEEDFGSCKKYEREPS